MASAAGAVLISVGEPVPDRKDPVRYRPGSEDPVIVLHAADPVGGLPWGLQIYDTAGGTACATVGRVNGGRLGAMEGDNFRPYHGDQNSGCGKLGEGRFWSVVGPARYEPDRTLVYGRAGKGVRQIVLTISGGRRTAEPGQGGAFLFVLDGRFSHRDLRVRPLGDGR
jgi:hypothetical protein